LIFGAFVLGCWYIGQSSTGGWKWWWRCKYWSAGSCHYWYFRNGQAQWSSCSVIYGPDWC